MLQAEDSLPEGAPEGAGGADGAGGDMRVVAFDAALAEVAARVGPAYREADGWLERTRAALIELLRFCDERPETARALVVDSIAWGPAVLERRGQALDALAQALARAQGASADAAAHSVNMATRADATPSENPAALPPGTAENLVGACVSLVHTRLLRGPAGPFVALAPSLMSTIVHPYLGPEAARRELERPRTRALGEAAARGSQRPAATSFERSY